jgi:hypothetical protein
MKRKKHRKPRIDQCRMQRTAGIARLTCKPVMTIGMSWRMLTMRLPMRRKYHRKPMMDQCTMWMIEGIVLESVKIGQYISDM